MPSRLLWLALYIALAAGGIWSIVQGIGGGWAAPLWSLLIGHSFAGAAFVGHETMHGAVIRSKPLRQLVGWVCFLPFTLSPTLWNAWHNKVHHGNTGIEGVDPDSFPSRAQYDKSRTTRVADYFAPGHGRPLGFSTLLFGFTGQSTQMLFIWMKNTDALDAKGRVAVRIETVLGWAVWASLAWFIGLHAFLFAFVLPLVVGNLVVISYILTNHSLSPMNDVNDPLLNSLTVTMPSFVNRLHLNFGLHVEHHLFPAMSSAYAPYVRDALMKQFPDQYQSMPFMTAMKKLFMTPRVYGTQTLLVDPLSGFSAETIAPRTSRTRSEPVVEAPRAPEPDGAPQPLLPSAA